MAFSYAADMEVLAYTSGSTEFTVGETITAAVGGATAVVVDWTLTSGDWGGTAAGDVYIKTVVGTFQAGALNGSVGLNNMATGAGASTPDYSPLNWLRLRIGDTDSSYDMFTDNELEAIITKCTAASVVNFDHAAGILLEILGIDAIRLVESRKATSGGIALADELDLYAKRSEVYLD